MAVRNPRALLDRSDRVIAVLAGRARGTFEDVLEEATSLFQRHSSDDLPMHDGTGVLPRGKQGRRGNFHSVITGFSYGGGQRACFLQDPRSAHTPSLTASMCMLTGAHE